MYIISAPISDKPYSCQCHTYLCSCEITSPAYCSVRSSRGPYLDSSRGPRAVSNLCMLAIQQGILRLSFPDFIALLWPHSL